jgi:hypothetical protein
MLLSPFMFFCFLVDYLPLFDRSIRKLRQGRTQTTQQEGHQARHQAIHPVHRVGLLNLPVSHQPQGIGTGNRVRSSAEHEVKAPDNFCLRDIGQSLEQRLLVAINHRGVLMGQKGADKLRRIGQRAAEQAQKGRPAPFLVVRHAQQGAEKAIDNLRRLKRLASRFTLQRIQDTHPFLVQPIQPPTKNLLHQRFL